MKYSMTEPCDQCPFLKSMSHGFTLRRLREFASGEFPCHQTASVIEGEDNGSEFHANGKSVHCAGALIWNEKRNTPHQMMRINERVGRYDLSKLNMNADVR